MSITIKRDTGIFGSMSGFTVLVDGEKVEKIQNNRMIDIEIPGQEASIQLSQLGVKTNKMHVRDGDRLEVSTNVWAVYSIFAVLIIYSLSRFFIPNVIRHLGLILYIVVSFFISGMFYRIEKVSKRAEVTRE